MPSGAGWNRRTVPTRHGDVKDSLADITRARTLLGYEPSVSLEEGLKKTIEWYRSAAN